MTDLEKFKKCTVSTAKSGRTSVKCRLGLWSVSAADSDRVYLEAFHYWRQYYSDGEYFDVLSR